MLGRSTDIFVVGGGPAGLALAIAARHKGFHVTVADGAEPPIDKACGEGLMPDGLEALRNLGVHLHSGDGAAVRGVRLLDSRSSVDAGFPSGEGLGIRRTVLHQKMIDHARSLGVEFLWKASVTGISRDAVELSRESVSARWIVGADGAGSRVRRWSGLATERVHSRRFAYRRHYRVEPWTDRVEVHWSAGVEAYVTPVGGDEVGVAIISRSVLNRLQVALEMFPSLAKRLRGAEHASTERGAMTAMHSLRRVCRGNVALIGDASGRVDAITGEGLALSFKQATALADALAANELPRYQTAHQRLLRRPFLMGRLLLRLDRHTYLRRRTLRVLARQPELFERLLAVHVGHASTAQLATAGAVLGWQMLGAEENQ